MILLAPFLVLASMQVMPASSDTAHLYGSCRAMVRMDDRTAVPRDVDLGEYCLGYMLGWFTHVGNDFPCAAATRATVARAYVAYLDANPRLFSASQDAGFYEAMLITTSCSTGR